MKVYFGFNDIRQDGMGSEAMALMRSLKKAGIDVQPVHAWKHIDVPGYIDEFNPVFICNESEDPGTENIIKKMVEYLNSVPENSIFSHFGAPNWVCVYPYLRKDIRVVISVHSISPSALKIATAYKERVSRFIAISWEVEKRLKKVLPASMHHKISFITNALNAEDYPEKDYDFSNSPLKVIFFGRIEDVTKGCDKIPEIASILKKRGINLRWDFYGYFHWGYEKRFYALNKKYDVVDVVAYKGLLQPNEVPAVLRQHDIMIMPSNHEGCPMALIEAMLVGLPSVVSYIHDVTNMMLEPNVEGILCKKNTMSEFADAIERLAKDKTLRVKMGKAAHAKAIKEYSTDIQVKKYLKTFDEALGSSDYILTEPRQDLGHFVVPEITKPHILARILPLWFKKILKRYLHN